jgi:hypothetical protein
MGTCGKWSVNIPCTEFPGISVLVALCPILVKVEKITSKSLRTCSSSVVYLESNSCLTSLVNFLPILRVCKVCSGVTLGSVLLGCDACRWIIGRFDKSQWSHLRGDFLTRGHCVSLIIPISHRRGVICRENCIDNILYCKCRYIHKL